MKRNIETIQKGDVVQFKKDYEGRGVVIDIIRAEIFTGFSTRIGKAYVLKDPSEPSGYRWHIASTYDHKYKCEVVVCDDDEVFYVEREDE